jgi:hypothetical protein
VTALPGRRRRSTLLAVGAAAVAVVLAIALGILGAVTLYHSTEGADAASGQARIEFPATPTELIAAVDDEGRLASMAVVVAKPADRGGSVIPVPVSADASGGEGDARLPVAETFQLEGPESLEGEAEILLGIELDQVAVVDAAQLAALLAPLGELAVDLPAAVTDASGDVVAEAGAQALDAEAAAAVLTARDPAVPAVDQYAPAAAVWAAVGEAAGDGLELTDGASSDVVAAAFDGPIGVRSLRRLPDDAAANPRGVDVSYLDRTDLALVFGLIAPGKMSAPNPALTVRIESPYSDEDLAGTGLRNLDLAREAVSSLLFVRGNVLSVDTTEGDVPATTTVEVADESLIPGTDGIDTLFGPVEVTVGESRIVGVDAVIRLGTSYLEHLAASGGPVTATTEASDG